MGSARDKGLRIAKEKMAPNMDAPNVQPILRPKYVLEAAALSCGKISQRPCNQQKDGNCVPYQLDIREASRPQMLSK